MVFVLGQEYKDGHEALSRHIVCVSAISDFKVSKLPDSNQHTVFSSNGGDNKPLFTVGSVEECGKVISNILMRHGTLDPSIVIDVNECITLDEDEDVDMVLTDMCMKLKDLGHTDLVERFYSAIMKGGGEINLQPEE